MATKHIFVPTTEPSITIGLDTSSVCVGYCVFRDLDLVEKGKYIHEGVHHCQKLYTFTLWLEKLFRRVNPTHVIMEMPHGGNGGKTLGVLMMYTTAVFITYYKVFNREFPDSCKMYPSAIKTILGVQGAGNHEGNKQIMVEHINKLFDLSLRYHKIKKNSDDDIADAIAVVVAWILRSDRDDGRYDINRDRARGGTKRPGKRR